MYRGGSFMEGPMGEEKSLSVSFRVTPYFKRLLQAAAERRHRSLTTLMDMLLFAHCVMPGLEEAGGRIPPRAKQEKMK